MDFRISLLFAAGILCGAKREGLMAGSGGSRRAAIDASGVLSAVGDSPAQRSTSHDTFEEGEADARRAVVVLSQNDVHIAEAQALASHDALTDAVDRNENENYPMYVCNSICAQCANGEAVFIRRAMTWKHFAVRAAFEVTIGSLSTVTAVTGAGSVFSYGLTAASEAAMRRASFMSLPNECKAISVLRTSNTTSLNETLSVNIAKLDKAEIKANPDLKLYMKNMNAIAQKEKDLAKNGSVSWSDWGKRIVGFERLYEKPGMVPETIEELTAHFFCGGDKGGLMRLDDDQENATVDNQTGLRGNIHVIEQESNWKAFARSAGSMGGIKVNQRKRLQAVGMCHAAAAKAQLEASAEEQAEDEIAAETWEKNHTGNESDLEKEFDKHENEVLAGIVDSTEGLSSWKIVYPKGVRVRAEPSFDANGTGAILQAEEIFFVDEVKSSGDSNMLRLADGRGWVFDKKGNRTISVPLESNVSTSANPATKEPPSAETSPKPSAEQSTQPMSTSPAPGPPAESSAKAAEPSTSPAPSTSPEAASSLGLVTTSLAPASSSPDRASSQAPSSPFDGPSEGPQEEIQDSKAHMMGEAKQVPVQKLELAVQNQEQDDPGKSQEIKKSLVRSEKSAAETQVANSLLGFLITLLLVWRS